MSSTLTVSKICRELIAIESRLHERNSAACVAEVADSQKSSCLYSVSGTATIILNNEFLSRKIPETRARSKQEQALYSWSFAELCTESSTTSAFDPSQPEHKHETQWTNGRHCKIHQFSLQRCPLSLREFLLMINTDPLGGFGSASNQFTDKLAREHRRARCVTPCKKTMWWGRKLLKQISKSSKING